MVVTQRDGSLYLKIGFLYPEFELPLDKIKNWGFVAEENGATYFKFNYGEATQHVSVPVREPELLHEVFARIEECLSLEPSIEIHESRVTKGQLLVAADISIGLLGVVLASATSI